MPKEKSINPAQAQRKAEKAKAIKKGKAEQQTRRNEKLAKRNPHHLQKQLDDLKAITSSGGSLTSVEQSTLEGLERDLKAVKRAREALGDAAPKFGPGGDRGERGERGGRGGRGGFGRGGGVLGKRRRDDESESEDDVPEDVKSIPMPRDTPPPIPKEVLDVWYQKRRERFAAQNKERDQGRERGTNANMMPLGGNARDVGGVRVQEERERPKMEAKTVYEAKPIVRDLRKEAVAFVPAAVRKKMGMVKGIGGLVEPEEADKLEREGYLGTRRDGSGERQQSSRKVEIEEVEDEDG